MLSSLGICFYQRKKPRTLLASPGTAGIFSTLLPLNDTASKCQPLTTVVVFLFRKHYTSPGCIWTRVNGMCWNCSNWKSLHVEQVKDALLILLINQFSMGQFLNFSKRKTSSTKSLNQINFEEIIQLKQTSEIIKRCSWLLENFSENLKISHFSIVIEFSFPYFHTLLIRSKIVFLSWTKLLCSWISENKMNFQRLYVRSASVVVSRRSNFWPQVC
jgi:hypothetical protein